jgi:hypothetical protein
MAKMARSGGNLQVAGARGQFRCSEPVFDDENWATLEICVAPAALVRWWLVERVDD